MKRIFLALVVVSFWGCKHPPKKLFTLIPETHSGISFSNRIQETDSFNILTYEYIYNGGGVGVGDFNNDGLQDVFFCGNMVPNRLYLNQAHLKFIDVTEIANVNQHDRWNSGVSVVDINNDGWLDIYVTATMKQDSASRKNMLFVNQGLNNNGIPIFIEQAANYKIDFGGHSVMSAFFDYDRDGDLDLYILTNVKVNNRPTTYHEKINDGSSPNNDRFFRNNGDGSFTDVTLQAGIKEEGFGLGLAVSDFNGDGWPDLYVSNDYLTNDVLYLNNRNGTFTNVTQQCISHQSQFSMGNDAADFNNDRLPDLITLDMLPENNYRKKTTINNKSYQTYINNEKYHYQYQYVRNMLHLNNGLDKGIKFSEVGQLAGVYQTEWSWSPLFADFDNDGWKDLLITNGFPKDITDKDFANFRADVGNIATTRMLIDSIPVVKIPHYAFRNNSNLKFSDVSDSWGLNIASFSNAAAFADLDNDGDLDYIVSNINDVAFLFENHLNDTKEKQPSFINIKFKGSNTNKNGVGARVTLAQGAQFQYSENSVYRGFLSSVESCVHFGLGSNAMVDSLLVEWPDGKRQTIDYPKTNETILVDYQNASDRVAQWPRSYPDPLVEKNNQALNIHFKHVEEDIIDYNYQRTLPHKFSQCGPSLAVGDVDGDGLEDMVIGASAGFSTILLKQKKNGQFSDPVNITDPGKLQEDAGLLLFDADNDGDLDLYAASGGSPFNLTSESYVHRLYLNDGHGQFTPSIKSLPSINSVGSCVRAADFDSDGDLDLFVGGRVSRKGYPLPGESFLLKNQNGKFTDESPLAAGLKQIGMVTDALWSDIDNDGKVDLIVVGELMPITFYKNDGKHFVHIANSGIENVSGCWNSLAGGDFDSDGDIDYIVGNAGLNNSYEATQQFPLTVLAKDFDGNGSIDPILGCFLKTSMQDPTKQLFPIHFWDELNSQSPIFRRKFSRYREFGKATLDQLLTPAEQMNVFRLEANDLNSFYIENLGSGKFNAKPLPLRAQVSPVNGLSVGDFNGDENLDVALVGNNFANEVFGGRQDAQTGTILIGDGKGDFNAISSTESGLYVPGDGKGLAFILVNGNPTIIATQNRDSLKSFRVTRDSPKIFRPLLSDLSAELISKNKKQRIEFYYGTGYLSQSSRIVALSKSSRSLKVHNYQGKVREIILDQTAVKTK